MKSSSLLYSLPFCFLFTCMANKIKCELCGQEFSDRGIFHHVPKAHGISWEEYKKKYNIYPSIDLYASDKIEGKDYVICKLCPDGKRFEALSKHLKVAHGISAESYRGLFPGMKTCSDTRSEISRSSIGHIRNNVTPEQISKMRSAGINNLVRYNQSDSHKDALRTMVVQKNISNRELAKQIIDPPSDFSI